ncbi:hypothetical protein KI387_022151, partial [Taxus chinensis]
DPPLRAVNQSTVKTTKQRRPMAFVSLREIKFQRPGSLERLFDRHDRFVKKKRRDDPDSSPETELVNI